MTCPRCRHPNPQGARYCEACAALLGRACASCGAALSAVAKFCHACAHPVSAGADAAFRPPDSYTPRYLAEKILTSRSAIEGERKEVTVLFADLKGSMELIAHRDPEDARKLLERVVDLMMQAVHRYEGTVNQVMGDGIMALFGAPLAHEDHAARACYAALQMQESVKRYAEELQRTAGVAVSIRVGLNSGEVVVGTISNDLRMDYAAVGQTTHLAARMEQMATPGSIFITGQTAGLTAGLTTRALGTPPVKGLQTPIEVYELLAASRARARLDTRAGRGPSRFVGREDELAELNRRIERARAGHGQVVALVGEPGVGKSRLVQEAVASEPASDWLVLQCGAISHGKGTPYLPVVELLQAYFGLDPRADAPTMREQVRAGLRQVDAALEPLLPALLDLLDGGAGDGEWSALDPAVRRHRTLDACKWLLLRQSQARPLMLVVEDLQWIDAESHSFLERLVESMPTARIVLLVTYRPEHEHRWASKSYYTQLRVDPLPRERARELLNGRLGDDASVVPLKDVLLERAEGNPFFLEESVRALVQSGDLVGNEGAHRLVRDVTVIQVPSTVNVVIAARIDRLPSAEKHLLQCAAVIGKNVPFTLLTAVADLDDDETRRALASLQSAEFLYETSLFPDVEYTFRHTLTHEVAYKSLLQETRRAHHRRIVDAIERLYADRLRDEVERLAYHAVRGAAWPQAVNYLSQAGRKAAARSAHIEAVASFERALEVLEHIPSSRQTLEHAIDLRFELRQSCVPLRDYRRVLDHLGTAEAVAEQLGDRVRLGWVFVYRAHGLLLAGEGRDAMHAGQRALELAQTLSDLGLEESANVYLGQASHWLGGYRDAVRLLTRNVTSVEEQLRRREIPVRQDVNSRTFLAWCLAELGDFAEGLAHADEAMRLAEASGSAYALVHAYAGAGLLHLRSGRFAEAATTAERAIELCRGRDFTALWAMPASILGSAYTALARPHDAIPILERAAGISSVLGAPVLGFLAEAYADSGRDADAQATGLRAQELAVDHGERGWEAWTLRLLGELAARRSEPDVEAAEDAYHGAICIADDLGMRPLLGRCRLGLAALYGRRGDARAREHLAVAESTFRSSGMTVWLEKARTLAM